jgi:myotubularin-related protein 1/2
LVWCCIVTFYRLVVFSYHESEFDGSTTTDNNIGQRDSASNEMMNWMATSSVSRQYQHAYLSRVRQSGKTHDVLQMPLASVDRIEKSADFGLNTSSALSAVNLIGSNSAVSSGYKDGIGGAVASGTLVVYGKDNGRFIQFTTPSYADSMRVYESLNTYAFPGRRNLGYLFAFESRRAEVMASTNMKETDKQQFGKNGSLRINARASPKRYDAIMEFNRMVSSSDNIRCPWVPILRSNSTYNLCASYPSILFAPNSVDDGKPEGIRLLRDTAAFRSGGRYQTLSWASRFDGASLWRSAQPKVGLQGNRSPADELFMKKIAESAAFANSQAAVNGRIPARPTIAFLKMLTGGINETDMMLDSFASTDSPAFNEKCMLKIFDLRPKSSAMANRTAGTFFFYIYVFYFFKEMFSPNFKKNLEGYGYENTSHYKNTTLSFFGIGNIHAVRDSYRKISALCASPATNDVQWMQLVEDTKWLSMIRLILSSSWQAAFHIRYNRLPVLVHCSHGWDRTSQVCALTQILLDPYYRTRSGFSCLVEKDFLSLGHPFHTRLGHGEGKGGDLNGSGSSGGQSDEMSPIFLQFLDCVFQIVNQYPDYFEFNTKYLLLISEHIYSCRFGTLLCDTEREREVVASIRQRTYCLWEYLESCPGLSNDNYCCSDILSDADIIEGKGCLLMPLSSLLRNVTLWVDRHCMHGAKPTLRSLSLQSYEDTKSVQETNEQPLHGFNDFRESSLVKEVAQLKGCIASKDEEISILRAQLKEATTKV